MAYVNNQTDTLFADVSEFQAPVDNSYLDAGYQVLSIRSNDGSYEDHNFAANYKWCVEQCDAGSLNFFIVYYYWRAGGLGVDTHKRMVNEAGGPHPRMVSMIDVESGGNQVQDWSQTLNDEYAQLAGWLGNGLRVIGYANAGDLTAMWPHRPNGLRLIGAGYGANPNLPGQVAHQYTDGQGYGGGLPEGAPPFGNCDMNSADTLSVAAFATAVGLGAAPVPPPLQPPQPTPEDPGTLPDDEATLLLVANAIVGELLGVASDA